MPSFLMQGFVMAVIKLYCDKFNVLLQKDDIPDVVTQSMAVLEEVAFNSAKFHNDIMETETLVKEYNNTEFLNFGLLTVFIAGQRSLPMENFMFTNVAFQDFLAARYLSKMDIDDFTDHAEQLVSDPCLHNISVYMSGLLRYDYHIRTMQELFQNLAAQNLTANRSISFLDEGSLDVSSKPTSAKSNMTVGKSSFISSSARTNRSEASTTKMDGRLMDFRLSLECLNECEGREDVAKVLLESLPRRVYMRSRDIASRQVMGGLCQVWKLFMIHYGF